MQLRDTQREITVVREGAWLAVGFASPQRAVSWAIVGGGFVDTHDVAWLEVKNADLPAQVDPRALLATRMDERGLHNGIGLLTSRRLDAYVDVAHSHHGLNARCIATVGLGNALRAGDAPVPIKPIGTINVLCHVSTPLSDHALLEGLALMSEAKALTIREANVPSFATGEAASGTGTDCLVIASPLSTRRDANQTYAGKHTNIGYLIGHVVREAIARGAEAWKAEQR